MNHFNSSNWKWIKS